MGILRQPFSPRASSTTRPPCFETLHRSSPPSDPFNFLRPFSPPTNLGLSLRF
ncbi:hypothetical protein LguiA_029803 [Lonicera macranthoides]